MCVYRTSKIIIYYSSYFAVRVARLKLMLQCESLQEEVDHLRQKLEDQNENLLEDSKTFSNHS